MNQYFEIALSAYLLMGLYLATLGPAGKDIHEEIDRARGTSLLNAYLDREPPSELKLLLFRVLITAGFVLLWPVFIHGIVKAQRMAKEDSQAFDNKLSQGLWFQYLGGYGSITCTDCHHNESITSFTHGRDSSTTGFQCQTCGAFAAIHSGGPGRASQYESSLTCECGGQLEREKVLFCPSCKSQKLSYNMDFIT